MSGESREREVGARGVGIVLCAAAGVWIGSRLEDVLLPAVLPLLIGAAAARIVSPSADAVSRAFRIGRKTGGAVWAALLCALTLWLTALVGGRLAGEIARILEELPGWITAAAEAAEGLADRIREKIPAALLRFIPETEAGMGGASGSGGLLSAVLIRGATAAAEKAASVLGQTVQGVGGGVLSVAVGAASFIWLTADPGGAWDSLLGAVPDSGAGMRFRESAERLGDRIRRGEEAMGRTLRAYLILCGVTFCILLPGFWLIGTENAPAAAFLTALVDLLPVLGCGTVLVPWAAVCFLTGESGRGIGLLLLLAAVWIVRQILEPRLIGRAAGIHPFLALTVSYLALRLFGAPGLILAALSLCVLRPEEDSADPTATEPPFYISSKGHS